MATASSVIISDLFCMAVALCTLFNVYLGACVMFTVASQDLLGESVIQSNT
jgi:hypothetical protein